MTLWHGCVTEVWPDGDTFTAKMSRADGDDGMVQQVTADFSMHECALEVEAGDFIRLDGEANQMSRVDMGVWTQAELDAIMKRADKRSKLMRRMTD